MLSHCSDGRLGPPSASPVNLFFYIEVILPSKRRAARGGEWERETGTAMVWPGYRLLRLCSLFLGEAKAV